MRTTATIPAPGAVVVVVLLLLLAAAAGSPLVQAFVRTGAIVCGG